MGTRAPDDKDPASPDLRERAIGGVLWSAVGTALRVGMQLAAQIALARLLGPEPFGLFAVALVVIALSGLFAEVGLAYGLIQKPKVGSEDIRFAFTWQLLLGLVVMAIVLASAGPIARALDDARAAGVLRSLAPGILLSALAATPTMLLRRRMAFKWLQLSSAAAYAVGYLGVGLPLALAGWQVGALVAAYLVHATLLLVLAFWKAPHSLVPLFWHAHAGGSMRFGVTALATNLVNWAMTGIDRLIVGKLYSVTAAGLYAQMHAFASSPALTLLGTVQQVLYSAGAAVQDDHARLRSALATMLGAAMLFAAPPFLSIALVSDTVVLALYGPRWDGAASLLTPLALAMPALVITGLVTPLLWNSGQIGRELQVQLPVSLAWAMLCLLLAFVAPLPAIGWGLAALLVLRATLMSQAAMRALLLPTADARHALRGGVTVAATTALLIFAADRVARGLFDAPAAWLATDIIVGAIAMPVCIVLARHWLTPALRFLLAQLAGRLPGRLGASLAVLFRPVDQAAERLG